MIDMVTGYDSIPKFQGLRFGQSVTLMPPGDPSVTDPSAPSAQQQLILAPPQSPANAFIESAVVFGGVPLCGYIFVTKKGPAAWLAALLGVGIGWLYWQSGSPAPALPPGEQFTQP